MGLFAALLLPIIMTIGRDGEGDATIGSTQGSGIAELWHHTSWTNLKRPINCGLLQLIRSTATCSDTSAVALEALHRVGRGPTGARPAAAWKDHYGWAMELDGKSIYKATLWRFKCKELTSLTIAPGVGTVVSIRGVAQELWAPGDGADKKPEEHEATAIVSTQGQSGADKEQTELGDGFDCHEEDAESLEEDDVLSEATARVLEQEPVVVDGPIFENKAPDIGSRPSCVWEQAELSGNDCHLHCLSVPLHEIHRRW